MIKLGKCPIIIPTSHGYDMLVHPGKRRFIENAIFFNGSYERGTIHLLDHCLREGDTFLDVGANIGMMSLFASKRIGAEGVVYAFEPQKEIYEILKKNIEINAATNIRPIRIGIGSSKKKAPFYRNITVGRGADSFIRESPEAPMWEESVEILPLDSVVEERGIETVRMIKIDVEGWELEVLKGAKALLSRPEAPILIVECSRRRVNKGSPEEIFEFIKSVNRYLIYRPAKNKGTVSALIEIKTVGDLPYHDNLFCCPPEVQSSLPKTLFQDQPAVRAKVKHQAVPVSLCYWN